MNKENVIEIRCKKCNKLMMEYFVCGDDSAVALQNIGIKCDRCKRVMILKKYSEGMMKEHSGNGTYRRYDTEACRQRCVLYLTDLGSVT